MILGKNQGSVGTFNLSGDGTAASATAYVGYGGTGVFNQSGGTFATNLGSSYPFYIGYGGTGTYNLSGTGNVATASLFLGDLGGTGTFNQTGGTYTLAGALNFGYDAAGAGAVTQGTYNLNGGVLQLDVVTQRYSTDMGVFNFNGGTLQAAQNRTDFFQGVTTANVRGGGATIDTQGYNITIAQNLLHSTLAADANLTTDGGLTKLGTGTLTLTGANTFNGPTAISAGTLALGSASALADSTLVTSSAGGALAFSGGVGSFTLGGLSGNGNITLTDANNAAVTPLIGANNQSTTYSGVLSGPGGLTKVGGGTLTLTGVNSFTGAVTLDAGTLAVPAESSLGAPVSSVNFNGGQLLFTGSATLARTYNLGYSTLTASAGNTLTFAGNTVNGGFLGGPGTDMLGSGTLLNGVTSLVNSTLTQTNGAATLNNTTIRGTLTQGGGTLAVDNVLVLGSGQVNVGGTINSTGTEVQGLLNVNNGGAVVNTGTNLYLTGGSRTTINPGGTLTAGSGTSIELNGSLLVNNGTQNGALNINYGSSARGTGFFGNVTVGPGGQFGNNAVSSGGTNAVIVQTASPFWQALNRPAVNPLPLVGPQAATTPQVFNVANLTLGAGSTFNFNLQNTQGPAGKGYDLTNVGNQLTLTGSAMPGNQIVIRLIGLDGNGNNGTVASFNPAQDYAFTLVHTANGITGYTAGEFTVNTAGFANGTQGGSFSVGQDGNDLVLVYNAVPEPSTWVLLGLGVSLLGVTCRQRRAVCG